MSTHVLFSYGTLRQPEVQRAQFGRLLDGVEDALTGYVLDEVLITDPEIVALSGSDRHPVLRRTGDPADRIIGTAFTVCDADLLAADEYEVDDYRRVRVELASGTHAWVYDRA